MKKIFTFACLLALGLSGSPTVAAAEGEVFDIEYNFDVDADFPDGANLPAGWAQDGTPLKRTSGVPLGLSNHSGDYILGAASAKFDEVIYTPLIKVAAGKPCSLEFQYFLPGGTNFVYATGMEIYTSASQSMTGAVKVGAIKQDNYKDWTKFSVTVTPEADGEMCFALKFVNDYGMTVNCGAVGLDSFFISGTYAVDEPAGTPFDVTFDFEDDADFPGVAYLPKGWLSTGTKPFMRKSPETLRIAAPADGSRVVGNVGATTKGDNVLITPLYNIEKGTPFTIAFDYLTVPQLEEFGYGFTVYAAPSQSMEEAVKVGSIAEYLDHRNEWLSSETFTFTPEATGKYYFIISPANESGFTPGGPVAFDNIHITGYEADEQPETTDVPAPPAGTPEAFEAEFNFDVDADFPDGANLPAGWKQDGTPLKRTSGAPLGLSNQSGDYILGAASAKFDEVIYTPLYNLVAGKPYTLEFQYFLSGGSNFVYATGMEIYTSASQSMDGAVKVGSIKQDNYKDWTKFSVTVTPEADGEMCFALKFVNDYGMTTNCGAVGLDSFFISGTCYGSTQGGDDDDPVIELYPNEDNAGECIELPYFETFSDQTHFTGDSYVPRGWRSTGSVTWVTASVDALPAKAGQYYLITNHNTEGERDDKAYTPFFNLDAGTEYTVSYYVYMQGNDYNEDGILYLPTMRFTVGTEHDSEFHNTISKFSDRTNGWVKQEHKFTPEASGPYCFSFALTGPVNSGYVAIDDVQVSAPDLIARVEPAFAAKALYSLFDNSKTVLFEGQPLKIVNQTRFATSYEWSVDGAEPATSTEAEPEFTFPASGTYTVTLKATNPRGTRTTQHTYNVQLVGKDTKGDQPLSLYNSATDRLYERGETPAFSIDPYDFITGYNHYYFELAQRFDLSDEIPVKLKQLSFYVTDRRYRGTTEFYDDQRTKPFSLAVYGSDANGNLDESNELGRIDTTIGEALGSSGLGGNAPANHDIVFDTPIEATGTIYVAMIFDRSMEVVPQDSQLGRSYIATSVVRHGHGQSSLYVKPVDTPEDSKAEIGKWTTVDALDSSFAGMSPYWMLWLNAYDETNAIEGVAADNAAALTACFHGDTLTVGGVAEGTAVDVYNIAGARVASFAAPSAAIAGLPAGIYLVKAGTQTVKTVK